MRRLATVGLVLALNGCGGAAPAPGHEAPAAPAAPALAEIPRTGGRAISTESDMRVLEPFTGDLDALAGRGVIRILVAPSGTHFDVTAATQRGRTVDAAIAFERFVNERIAPQAISVLLISTSDTALVNDLIAGQGDIAANVLRTFERDEQVAFATPVRTGVREIIVTGPGVKPLVSLEDAGGRAIHVRRNSDHHASLERLNGQLEKIDRPAATIRFAAGELTDEELLAQVNAGRIPATVVDDYIYDARAAELGSTAVNRDVAVSQDGEIAWVTRPGSPRLLTLINEFFAAYRLSF
jgi:membrane-bound lytic murein transglycosylase MltF